MRDSRLDAAEIDHVLFAKIAIVKSNDKYFLSISLNDFLKILSLSSKKSKNYQIGGKRAQ